MMIAIAMTVFRFGNLQQIKEANTNSNHPKVTKVVTLHSLAHF